MPANNTDDKHNTGNSGNKAAPVLHASISAEFDTAISVWLSLDTNKPLIEEPRSELVRLAMWDYIKSGLSLIEHPWAYVKGSQSDLSDADKRTAGWLNTQYLLCVNQYVNKLGSNPTIVTEMSNFVAAWSELNPFKRGDLLNAVTTAIAIPQSRTMIERAQHSLGVLALEASLVEPTPRVRRTAEQIAADKVAENA